MSDFKLDDEAVKNRNVYYGGFWMRLIASLLDGLILSPLYVFMFFNFMGLKSMSLMILLSITGMLYKPIMEGKYGYTLGKKIVGLKIVNESLEQISMLQALQRWIPWLVGNVLSLISNILWFNSEEFKEAETLEDLLSIERTGFIDSIASTYIVVYFVIAIMIIFDERKQGLHDKMGNTLVIESK